MSKKPPPQVLFNFQEDDIVDETNEETGEENPNFIYPNEEEDEEEDDSEELIKMEVKEELIPDDIFDDMPAKEEAKPAKKEKSDKVKKPRKPMSEEHKAKLALARDKAVLVRKANAIEKKKMKELESEEKELLVKQKIKRFKKLKEDVEDDEDDKPVPKPVSGITKKDLEEAQLDAIIKYEAIRKERKAKKKEEQMIQEGKNKMLNTIQRATGQYNYRDGSNKFDNCY